MVGVCLFGEDWKEGSRIWEDKRHYVIYKSCFSCHGLREQKYLFRKNDDSIGLTGPPADKLTPVWNLFSPFLRSSCRQWTQNLTTIQWWNNTKLPSHKPTVMIIWECFALYYLFFFLIFIFHSNLQTRFDSVKGP